MLKELIEQRNDFRAEMQSIFDTAKGEGRAISAEEKERFDALEAKISDIDNTIEIEKKMEGVKDIVINEPMNQETKDYLAFANFLRNIKNADAPITKSDNGALIPTTIANKIIDEVKTICPIFSMSEIYNIKGTLTIPYVDQANTTLTMAYATEFVEPDSTTVKTANITLTGYLAEALTKVSKDLINSSDFDIVNFVIGKIAVEVARFIEKELLVGTAGKITGLSTATNNVATASATAITSDELIDVQEAVIDAYQANAIWIMSRETRKAIRKLKDGDGNYLLNKDFASQWGYTLLGKPVYASDSMPGMAAGKVAIYYGDMKGLATKISEDINTQVLYEKYAVEHALGIVTFVNLDSKVQDQQKIAKLTMKTA